MGAAILPPGASLPPPPHGHKGPWTILHALVDELKHRGRTSITTEDLEKVAATGVLQLQSPDTEKSSASPPDSIRKSEKFNATMEAGQTVLKTAIGINGAAAAGPLAFLGSVAGKPVLTNTRLPYAMLAFV